MEKCKRAASIFLCLMLSCGLGSCMDLGVGDEEDAFKKYISKVVLLSPAGKTERSISAFSEAISLKDTGMRDDVVDYKDYCYVGFKVSDLYTVEVDEFAFFAKTQGASSTLELEFYVSKLMPTKIKGKSGETVYFPDTPTSDNEVYVPETNEEGAVIEREGEKGENVLTDRYYDATFAIGAEWDSVLFEFPKPQTVNPGNYIVIKVKNNCVLEEETQSSSVSFTINYLLFRFTGVS